MATNVKQNRSRAPSSGCVDFDVSIKMRPKPKSLAALLMAILVLGCTNPWADKSLSHGVDRGTKFEVLHDSFLYCYLGDQLSLVPPDDFGFSPEEFAADPSLGIIDREHNIYVAKVIPAGSQIRFERIVRKSDWNTGGYYVQYARFLDPKIFDKEISIGRMLDGDYSVDSSSEHLRRIE